MLNQIWCKTQTARIQQPYAQYPKRMETIIKIAHDYLGHIPPLGCSITIDNKHKNTDEITTKEVYSFISVKWKMKPATSKKKWTELYDDINLKDEYWELICKTPSTLTKKPKVLMIQCKIIIEYKL